MKSSFLRFFTMKKPHLLLLNLSMFFMRNHVNAQIEAMTTVSNHFFIEITEQNNAYAFKAGQFETTQNGHFKKHFLADTKTDWEAFWTVFQAAYQRKALENKADVLFYIHGFWSGSTFQLDKNLRYSNDIYVQNPNSPIALTITVIWHRDYKTYRHTRGLCKNRAEAFAPCFWSSILKTRKLLNEEDLEGKTHLLCHSMGNYFLENMLPLKPTTDKPLFQELVMAAADVKDDFYEQQNSIIAALSYRTLALNNQNDRSLTISKWLNQHTRLGKHPPQYFNNKYASVFATEVSGVGDVKNVMGYINQHQHHQLSKKVIYYLSGVFKGEKTVEVLVRDN